MHRHWQPKCTHEGQCDDACFSKLNAHEQLVLPQACPQAVLHMAHNIPLAGHQGREKTADCILRFFWPGIHADVEMHCAQCRECQLTARPVNQRVRLVSMPVVSEPFALLAMDIVGPLERTVSGNKYILVLVDYATRYPEAIPLRPIDDETIADEFIRVFTRTGIPQKLLTDQGSNFTSTLMKQVLESLNVTHLRTSPYHPQTDRVVERLMVRSKQCCDVFRGRHRKIGMNCCHTCCLHIEKSHRLQRDSHLLNCSMEGMYVVLWMY